VEVAEQHADGTASDAMLNRVWEGASEVVSAVRVLSAIRVSRSITRSEADRVACEAAYAAWGSAFEEAGVAAEDVLFWHISDDKFRTQIELIRDLFGNPFRCVTVDPSWLTYRNGTVSKLAATIYEERAFDRMPLLADALEDAGCTDPSILDHLRGPGPHVRGCWVVDLLLGKE
jgi:hypothetical protein